MNKKILITALTLGVLAVILGAFGAHGLKELVDGSALNTFETGVRYQMYHALFLLFVGGTAILNQKTMKNVFYMVLLGIIFFSGSIYGLATNELTSFDFKAIGFITPIGGLLLILAWIFALIDIFKKKEL